MLLRVVILYYYIIRLALNVWPPKYNNFVTSMGNGTSMCYIYAVVCHGQLYSFPEEVSEKDETRRK